MEKTELKKYTRLLAQISGKIIKQYFNSDYPVDIKGDLSPVTIADKLAEEKMRELIMTEFPDHGIIGEEFGNHQPDAEYCWILDPIDGTKTFISGVPLFGTLIGLTKNKEPLLGAINLPVLDNFIIGDNYTSELNGTQVKFRECSRISDAFLLTTDYLQIKKYQDINRFNRLLDKVKLFRTWGDCYGYYLLAAGKADIMIDPKMSVWDITALIPIIKGAGGIITDYSGGDPVNADAIIAASPEIHPGIIQILNS